MEIERKWLVTGWPSCDLPLIARQQMSQGYINVRPTVRIRKEVLMKEDGDSTDFVLCIKSGTGIAREEIEISIPEEKFADLERVIGLPLIGKERRTYLLSDGCHLEVNHVGTQR